MANLPTRVLPEEGFPKLAEFWGAMGAGHRWKPAVYLVVTLPVMLQADVAGPMVTTRITEYRQRGAAETAAVWIQIGGHVLDAINLQEDNSPTPVKSAWVRLETTDGSPLATTETDEGGRFSFSRLQMGDYALRARVPGFAEALRSIGVPSPGGNYDIELS